MTDNTQPEALRLALSIDLMDTFTNYQQEELNKAAAELRRQHARIAELEAQLESIGAGGVSGPLMDRAADHFPDVTKMASRWYVLNKDGMATLCADKADAEQEAIDAQAAWPGVGPHRAVQLVEAGASLPLPGAQEAVAWAMFADNGNIRLWSKKPIPHPDAIPLYAAPQPALSAGWVSLSGALPKPGTPVLLDIGNKYPIRAQWVPKDSLEATGDGDFGEYNEASDMYYWPEGWYEWNQYEETHWRVDETPRAWQPLPASPTIEGESNGAQ